MTEEMLRETRESGRPIAVIDTETNWNDAVMSVGVVLAAPESLQPFSAAYYILTPEVEIGGMYESSLYGVGPKPLLVSRAEAVRAIREALSAAGVREIFAYNARFDAGHLPELASFDWYDIMRLASYRQYNRFIPETAELCCTGRMRRGFGVERMLRMMRADSYRETHNAAQDALDELTIMRELGHPLEAYAIARVGGKKA